jgi:hypothetical protein
VLPDADHDVPGSSAVATAVHAIAADAGMVGRAADMHASIEGFLSGIGARAFRFAELGLRHREDALDAVQDAMMRMLGYRERPAADWTPLFWSILRRRMIDLQRRRAFSLRWMVPTGTRDEDASVDWKDEAPDPIRGSRPRCPHCQGDSAKPSPCACWKNSTWRPRHRSWIAAKVRSRPTCRVPATH